MTQNAPIENIDNANPYNAKKSYHTPDEPNTATAQSAFFPERHGKKVEQPKESVQDTTQVKDTSNDDADDKHDYKKRWTDLKKRYDTEITKYRQELDSLKENTGDLENVKVPETPEELKQFMKDEPALYNLFKGIAKLEVEQDSVEVKEKIKDIESRELKLAKEQAIREVKEVHNDFDQITESDDFHDWAEAQPKSIQDMVYTTKTDSSALIRAIDLYKADVAKLESTESAKQSQAREKVDASSLVSTRTAPQPSSGDKKVWTESEIRKLSLEQYDALEAEIDKAIFEGRVIPG